MARPVAPGSAEYGAGMEVFYTDTPPLGGKLRARAEDFVVTELGPEPRPDPDGKHLALRVRLVNWEHNHFVRDASRMLRAGRNSIGFAGTKDKRAVTEQWFTVRANQAADEIVERVRRMPRVEVLGHHRTTKSLRLGMHQGNAFHIVVREIDADVATVQEHLDKTLLPLQTLAGSPNFFGIQRFGAVRPITHHIGKHIVDGDLEAAVVDYVTSSADDETDDVRQARDAIRKDRDWKAAQQLLPTALKFELAVVQHLAKDPDDAHGALRQLPDNLVLLFVHAYQSFLFNRMLSARIAAHMPLDEAVEGDIVYSVHDGKVDDRIPIPVTAQNVAAVNRQLKLRRGAVTLPLVGYDTPRASGEPGEIEARIIDEERIDPAAFKVPVMPKASSTGLRRVLVTRVTDLEAIARPDEAGEGTVADIHFALPKGSYATSLLREVLKADDTTRY